MMTDELQRVTPETLTRIVKGTTYSWWNRRMKKLLELRDKDERPVCVMIGNRYFANIPALYDAILRGGDLTVTYSKTA